MKDQGPPGSQRLDAAAVGRLRQRASTIFGQDELDQLMKLHRDGNPPIRHRFADLMSWAEDAAAGKLNPIAEDAAWVGATEVDSVLTFAEEWEGSPAWPEVRRGLRASGEYLHAVGTIAIGSLLRVRHPSTEIVVATGARRQSDLRLSVPEIAPLLVEVKAPQALWQPRTTLDLGDAAGIVRKVIGDAGTSETGQLPPDQPGILAIAGLLMSQQTYDTLVTAFEIVLTADGRRWPQLLGLAVSNLRQGAFPAAGRVSVTLEQQSVLRRNPAYTGVLWVSDDWSAPWSVVQRSADLC